MGNKMDYIDLFNITSPEEVRLKFEGKIGRIALSWREGQWIITNKRLIFVSDGIFFDARETFGRHFQRPLALIILRHEIKQVIKGETKIIVKYTPRSQKIYLAGPKELGIGFFKRHFEIVNRRKYSKLLETVYKHLKNPEDAISGFNCPRCNALMQKTDIECPKCGTPFKICAICKFQILHLNEQTQCPYCLGYFHKVDLLEWLKVHGTCPICDFRITPKEVLQAEKGPNKFVPHLY